MRLYGITVEEYELTLSGQGGVCAICGNPPINRRLAVDHDHKTGETRGLLCWRCNRTLAALDDNPALALSVAGYLTNPPIRAILGETVIGRTGRVSRKAYRPKKGSK